MKKQFFRVKQLADQTFLRAEKSEAFNNEELQIADQKVEYLHSALSAISKKIPCHLQGVDLDKRMRKTWEYQLYSTFKDERAHSQLCQLFPLIFKKFSQVEHDLAKEYSDHEIKIEDLVSAPLQKIIDSEIPNISKHKKNLSKYCLDKDSASNRYQSTKKETVKEDMEEADTKVEQTRDILALEMFSLLAKENEFASILLQLLKLQRGYHESALKNLERIIPDLEKVIGDSPVKRVFGISLHEHLRVNEKRIAYPLEICISALSEYGMLEEGLFRIAGSMSKVKRLKASIDSGSFIKLEPEYRDVHLLASVLKLYLRELPEPLLTYYLHNEWMKSMQVPESQRVDVIKKILTQLPQENRDNLAYLIQFLAKLAQHPENKMSPSNIAIVIAPNLLWNRDEQANLNMGNCNTVSMLVELFIKEVNSLFPEDVSHYVNVSGIFCDEDMVKTNLPSSRITIDGTVDLNMSTESINTLQDSPKPHQRSGKKRAPGPPSKTDQDIANEKISGGSSYPSGSTTLNRPQKSKIKSSIGVNTDENALSLCRNPSFTKEDINPHKNQNEPKVSLVNVDSVKSMDSKLTSNKVPNSIHNQSNDLINLDATVDHKYVTQPAANIQISKAKPVEQIHAQNAEGDKNFKTTVTHQIGHVNNDFKKTSQPVAAPRSLVTSETDKNVNKTNVLKYDMSKSLGDEIQFRKTDIFDRSAKPEVPARPASLSKKSSIDIDPLKTQLYSLNNKQQPSLVNIQNRNEKYQPGHDNQIAEKEKFLGHQPEKAVPLPRLSLSNRNFETKNELNNVNCSRTRTSSTGNKSGLPPKCEKSSDKPNVSKSNEKLNESSDRINGNQKPSHTRTRSDGNIIDLSTASSPASLLQTPPSPRSLNKPTEPPPPPPVLLPKSKPDDSTDL